MFDFNEFCKFINNIVNNYANNIVSIYLYGSSAQGIFEDDYSDIDMWIILRYDSIMERIKVTKDLMHILKKSLQVYLERINNLRENERIFKNTLWFFSEEEFKKYIELYPMAIIYQVKNNDSKLIYGKNLFKSYKITNREISVEYLQYDFEMHVDGFIENFNNVRGTIKSFLEILKIVIWILEDKYLDNKDIVLNNADQIFQDDNEVVKVIQKIKLIKKMYYKIEESDYINLYYDCCKIIESYGKKIKYYIEQKNFAIINEQKFYSMFFWGSYARTFPRLIMRYCSIINPHKSQLLNQLLTNFYELNKYFITILTNNLYAKDIYFESFNTYKRSRILNSININKSTFNEVLNLDGFKFLISEHKQNIEGGRLHKMDRRHLIQYIEEKYLPSVNEIYSFLLLRESQ